MPFYHTSGASDRSETVRFPAMQLKTNAAGPLIDNDPNSLANRLKLDPSEEDSLLPTQLLRKYIAYARQYATPKLSEEAKEVMRAFYLHLRQTTSPLDGTPVTARQLESMVRLGEARAKADLREVVTKQDAEVHNTLNFRLLTRLCTTGGTMSKANALVLFPLWW